MRKPLFLLAAGLLLASCQKEEENSPLPSANPNVAIEDLVVSPDFDFRTDEQVTLSITDPETYRVKYTVYAAFDGQQEEKVSSFLASANNMDVRLTVPTF